MKYLSKKPAICAATKCDLLSNDETVKKLAKLKELFGYVFLATSAKKLSGLEKLRELIRQNIIAQTSDATQAAEKTALTERHRKVVIDAIKNIENASDELKKGNEEITAFVLRSALQNLSGFETEHIDEQVLEMIFSRFCIGK